MSERTVILQLVQKRCTILINICSKLEDGDSKPLFRFIASKKGSSNNITQLDNCPPNDNDAIAEQFANSFASVFTLDNGLTSTSIQSSYESESITFTDSGILKQLQNLDPRKGAGPDNLPPALLKFLAPYIYKTVSKFFQYCYDSSSTPQDWRSANIIPIHKKGSKSDPLNYRPISITSVLSKIFEHIISHNIHNYLERHNLFFKNQHGFRSKHGCDTQLLETVTEFVDYYDDLVAVDVAVLDFSKAFDVVSHPKLVAKLNNLGIHPLTVNWISSWLQQRDLSVCVNNVKSTPRSVSSGVPQGSVLGPLLFNIFINDMPDSVAHSTLKLYADDSLLFHPINSPDDPTKLQSDLDSLVDWAKNAQMKFNVDKCEYMCISRKPNETLNRNYSMSNKSLTSVDEINYLGVTIDNKLSFNNHINNICKKASKTLFMLMRCLKKAKSKTRRTAYYTICRPVLEFATHTWSPYKQKHIRQLEGINRKAFRWVYNLKKYDHISDLMIARDWPTLSDRRINNDIKMYNRIMCGKAALDIEKYSLHTSESHNTRYGATKGCINTDTAKYSFKHRIHKLLQS